MLKSKVPNALENNSLAASFLHLKLRWDGKEGYMAVGECKAVMNYRIVSKIMGFLEGG